MKSNAEASISSFLFYFGLAFYATEDLSLFLDSVSVAFFYSSTGLSSVFEASYSGLVSANASPLFSSEVLGSIISFF